LIQFTDAPQFSEGQTVMCFKKACQLTGRQPSNDDQIARNAAKMKRALLNSFKRRLPCPIGALVLARISLI
jgi:hypothetical protein